MDVRLTGDGYHVLMHSSLLDRTTDGKGSVEEHTMAQIKRLDAGSRSHPDTLLIGYNTPIAYNFIGRDFWKVFRAEGSNGIGNNSNHRKSYGRRGEERRLK